MASTDWVGIIYDRARENGAGRLLCRPQNPCPDCQAILRTLSRTVPEIQAEAAAVERVSRYNAIEVLLARVEQEIERADGQRDWRARADGLAARKALVEALNDIRVG